MTDRNKSVIGLGRQRDGDRVRYSAFGVPTLLAKGDADGGGQAVQQDQTEVFGAWGHTVGSALYASSIDLDRSGTIDFGDVTGVIGNWLSTDTRDRVATNDGSSIGYTGTLWDPQTQMSLMRKRWHDPHAETGPPVSFPPPTARLHPPCPARSSFSSTAASAKSRRPSPRSVRSSARADA